VRHYLVNQEVVLKDLSDVMTVSREFGFVLVAVVELVSWDYLDYLDWIEMRVEVPTL
jgi:hypothetical protein